MLGSLCQLVNQDGLREHLRFTSALSNGHDLYAFRFAANDRANSLYYREDGDQVIAVSEPYDREPDWIEVPPDHVLVARASCAAEIVPLFAAGTAGLDAERKRSQRVVGDL